MKDGEKTKIGDLANQVEVVDKNIEYHPSIRALVRFLARRAADHDYKELLEVLDTQAERIIESAGKDKS
jgi:hypothetical protein